MAKKIKGGVAVDAYKVRTYKRAIKEAGFEIESVTPGKQFTVITVLIYESQKDVLAALLRKLEKKYSHRNRMN